MKNAFEKRIMEGILSDYSWPMNWKERNNRSQKFQNFYLLRDLDWCKAYERDEQGNEKELEATQKEYFHSVKDYFLQMEVVKNYFKNPLLNWERSSMPNQDGSGLIVENLLKITSNYSKTKRLVNIANSAYDSFLLEMPKAKDGDVSSMIKEAKRKAHDISARLGNFVEDGGSLGELQELYMVKEEDIYESLLVLVRSHKIVSTGQLKKYFTFLFQHPELKTNMGQDKKLEILMTKLGYDSKEELIVYLEQDLKFDLRKLFDNDIEKLQKKSTYLAAAMKDHWIDGMLNRGNESLDSDFVSLASKKTIATALRNNFVRLGMVDIIAEAIKDYVDDVELNDDAFFMVSNIITGIINNFVTTAGWKYTSDAERKKIRRIALENNVNTFEVTTTEKFNAQHVDHGLIQDVFGDLENEVNLINESIGKNNTDVVSKFSTLFGLSRWQDCLKFSFMANLEEVNYDIKSNDRLKEILSKGKQLDLSI